MPFVNRNDAGRKLAAALARYRGPDTVVLALPRGGVPVAAEIARVLDAPLDLILVRKLGVPFQPELAMGAIVNGGSPLVVRNEHVIRAADIDEADFNSACEAELREIERRRDRYLGTRERVEIAGRTVIVVDDGIATGATMRAALRGIRLRRPKKLIVAVPVAAPDSLVELQNEADDIICLESYENFDAIGLYYRDFNQVSDSEVIEILHSFPARAERAAGQALVSPVLRRSR